MPHLIVERILEDLELRGAIIRLVVARHGGSVAGAQFDVVNLRKDTGIVAV